MSKKEALKLDIIDRETTKIAAALSKLQQKPHLLDFSSLQIGISIGSGAFSTVHS